MTTPKPEALFSVQIAIASTLTSKIEACLDIAGIVMTSWEDVDAGTTTFDEYFLSLAEAETQRVRINAILLLWLENEIWELRITRVENHDWSEYWKRFFPIQRVSEHVVIKPSWETYSPRPGDCVIDIDSGMSFGTGRHPTSRSILRFLDELAPSMPGASFMDVGCGSGLLLIGAALLGYSRITGIDNDPVAIQIATENLRRNRVEALARSEIADALTYTSPEPFDIVSANMFCFELEQFSASINRLVSSRIGSRLLIAGTMNHQYADTLSHFNSLGFAEERHVVEEDWTGAVWRRV